MTAPKPAVADVQKAMTWFRKLPIPEKDRLRAEGLVNAEKITRYWIEKGRP